MKNLTLADINIKVHADFDDTPIRGNAMASGNDEEDKQVEDAIIDRVDSGDVWGWALVCVSGSYKGLTANDYLGACVYEDKEDFINNSGYYNDMCQTVLDDLQSQLNDLCAEDEEDTNGNPYLTPKNQDLTNDVEALTATVLADMKNDPMYYAELVADMYFHWKRGTKVTPMMRMFDNKNI